MQNKTPTPPKKIAHKYLKIFLLVFLTLGFAASLYGVRLYTQAKTALNSSYKSVGKDASARIQKRQPLSILLLGVDTGAEGRIDKGNSDTILLATINNTKQQTNLISVPRDTMAEIQHGNQPLEKVNAAYNVGSSLTAINTVSKLINTPIHYYATIDMGGLSKVVDAVGGVDVDVPFSFNYDWSNFKKGPMHLNGKQALAYSRMRYQDPENDYGRQKRQQQVIKGIVKSALSIRSLTNFENIITTVSAHIRTNLTFDDMLAIYQNYRGATKSIKSDHIQGKDAWVSGVAYQVAPTKELQRISNKARASLDLPQETLNNEETRLNKENSYFFQSDDNQTYYANVNQ